MFYIVIIPTNTRRFQMTSTQLWDLLRAIIVLICCGIFGNIVTISVMYHHVRGQSILKLYVIFNVLEVRIYPPSPSFCDRFTISWFFHTCFLFANRSLISCVAHLAKIYLPLCSTKQGEIVIAIATKNSKLFISIPLRYSSSLWYTRVSIRWFCCIK